MPNLTDDPAPATAPTLLLPLPGFRQPIRDPELPAVTDDPVPATDRPQAPSPSSRNPLQPSPSTESDTSPRVPSLEAPTPTATSSRAGDPKVAGEVIAGIFALACGYAAWWFGRRRRSFRQPTAAQVTDIATPLGNLAARHLPTEFISKDLVDATHAAGALHRYLIDGPLVVRDLEPIPDLGEPQ
jgi:hypothetical protein